MRAGQNIFLHLYLPPSPLFCLPGDTDAMLLLFELSEEARPGASRSKHMRLLLELKDLELVQIHQPWYVAYLLEADRDCASLLYIYTILVCTVANIFNSTSVCNKGGPKHRRASIWHQCFKYCVI